MSTRSTRTSAGKLQPVNYADNKPHIKSVVPVTTSTARTTAAVVREPPCTTSDASVNVSTATVIPLIETSLEVQREGRQNISSTPKNKSTSPLQRFIKFLTPAKGVPANPVNTLQRQTPNAPFSPAALDNHLCEISSIKNIDNSNFESNIDGDNIKTNILGHISATTTNISPTTTNIVSLQHTATTITVPFTTTTTDIVPLKHTAATTTVQSTTTTTTTTTTYIRPTSKAHLPSKPTTTDTTTRVIRDDWGTHQTTQIEIHTEPTQTTQPTASSTHTAPESSDESEGHETDNESVGDETDDYWDDIDIDCQDDMANTMVPPTFHGLPSENPIEWIKNLRLYLTVRRYNDTERTSAMGLLLRDSAKQWFDCMEDVDSVSFDCVVQRFLDYFKLTEASEIKNLKTVLETKQLHHESVDAYISKMVKLAATSKALPEQVRFAICSGLKPTIRQAVLIHECKTIDDLRTVARRAESMSTDEPSTTDQNIEIILARLDQLTPRPLDSRPTDGPGTFSPQSTTSAPRNQPTEQYLLQSNPAWHPNNRRFGYARGPAPPPTRPNYYTQRGMAPQQIRGTTYYRPIYQPRSIPQQSQGDGSECHRCGYNHGSTRLCPALNNTCIKCGKLNHFAKVCRAPQHSTPTYEQNSQ